MATTVLAPLVSLLFNCTEYKAGLSVGSALTSQLVHNMARALTLGVGTGANIIDTIYSARAAIASGTPLDTDVRGSLVSALDGTVISFPLIAGVLIVNNSTTSGQFLTWGVGANPVTSWMTGTTPAVIIGAGGFLFLTSPIDGYATVNATADIMRLTSATGTIQTDIIVFGRQS